MATSNITSISGGTAPAAVPAVPSMSELSAQWEDLHMHSDDMEVGDIDRLEYRIFEQVTANYAKYESAEDLFRKCFFLMQLVSDYPGDELIYLLVCDIMKGVFWLKPGRKEEAEKRRAGGGDMTDDSKIEALVDECRAALAHVAEADGTPEYDQAQQRVMEVSGRLAATPANTMLGIYIKATVLHDGDYEAATETGNHLVTSALKDIKRMAGIA